MNYFWFIILLSCSTFTYLGEAQTKPFLISCGTNSSVNAGGRTWVGDSSAQNLSISFVGDVASTSTQDTSSIYGRLYSTVRLFSKTSNYTFKLSPGDYYLRLHFLPFLLGTLNVNDSLFDVTANSLKLVSQFNVTSEISRKNSYLQNLGSNFTHSSLIKEYFLNVATDELLIRFSPADGSFAFINAMEIIPVFQPLFADSIAKVGGSGGSFSMDSKAMETMYRLNVGGSEIGPDKDQGLWRRWENDRPYMFTADASTQISNSSNISYASAEKSVAAPLLVYEEARTMTNAEVLEKRFNMSWKFEVNPNFDYLLRLHFCELHYDSANQRVFRIYINNRTASENFDVFMKAGGKNRAYYQDYVDSISQRVETLWIQLGPDIAAAGSDTDALLNGLEIFKISRNGNLAYIYETVDAGNKAINRRKSKSKILWAAVGGVSVLVAIISASCTLFFCFYKRKKETTLEKNQPHGWRPLFLHAAIGSTNDARASKYNGPMATSRIGRRFTISEVKTATKNFDESLVIGTGGFGKVYKGEIEDGTPVAIKRAHPQSEQGLAEFETEIEMLSKLRHRHLVSMIGFCEEHNEMILVYEYMANGTLRSHLFGCDLRPLSWKQRLDACIGAARGLHYLHTGAEGGIIHRDVKTTNILLDNDFVAKVADFGLSKTGPSLDQTHVSTAVKGSFGYLDPEYFRRQKLTEKSDVYSFGVVLFEVVCGRPVINPSLPRERINLAEWAIKWQRQGSLETIVDPRLDGAYSLDSLRKFGDIAEKCLADEGKNRPTMGEVLWHLEYVLQLQEASTRSNDGDSFSRSDVRYTNALFNLPNIGEGGSPSSSSEEDGCQRRKCEDTGLSDRIGAEGALRGADFSQMADRIGR